MQTAKQPPQGATCTECVMGSSVYVPCGKIAVAIINNRGEINNMCQMDADHNVANRGAFFVLADDTLSRERSLIPQQPDRAVPPANAWPVTNVFQEPEAFNSATIFNTPTNPIDPMQPARFASLPPGTKDEFLMRHSEAKKALDVAKEAELSFRLACALILTRGSNKQEGMVNVDLGQGFVAKVGLKKNYKLISRDDKKTSLDAVDDAADKMAEVGAEGGFIAERIFKWSVDISIGEYHKLEEAAATSADAAKLLAIVNSVLEISDATPTLEIKEPKAKAK